MTPAPLHGIRVLEVGHMLAGPYATMLLADLGADVTKIEPPGGDISRQVGDSYFASLNRGKRSVCLDLASPAGRARLGELVAGAHALLRQPQAVGHPAARAQLRRAAAVERADRLRRPHRLRPGRRRHPAFDYLVQAATGVAALTGDPDGPPALPGYSSADNSAGLAAALGLLAQIVSGRGGQVDVLDARGDAVPAQLPRRGLAQRRVEPRRLPRARTPTTSGPAVPDGRGYLALFITHDGFWKSFAAEAGIDGFATMAERTSRRAEVLAVVTRPWPPTPPRAGRPGCAAWASRPRPSARSPRRSTPPRTR